MIFNQYMSVKNFVSEQLRSLRRFKLKIRLIQASNSKLKFPATIIMC